MRLVTLKLATPAARHAYCMIVTALCQEGASVAEAWEAGAKYFSKWLSKHEKQNITVTTEAFRDAFPWTDNTMETKLTIGMLVAAEIIDRIRDGAETADAVKKGYERFRIYPGKEELMSQIKKFEAERIRIQNLRPHQMDDGAGGTVDIIVAPRDVDPTDKNAVEREGSLVDKKSLQNPENLH